MITEIGFSNNIGSSGDLLLKGFSPTILLENGKHNQSFTQKNLVQTVKAVCGHVPSNLLKIAVNPKFKSSIPYVVQYKETAFEFIRRLAAEYGEWFFFLTEKFEFWKPSSSSSTIDLKYPRDISELNLHLKVAPLKFNQIEYFSKDNEKFVTESDSQQVTGLDKFGNHTVTAANKLFTTPVSFFFGQEGKYKK